MNRSFGQRRGSVAEHLECARPAAYALEANLDVFAGPDEVVVIVDQSGDHRPAAEIHHLGRRPRGGERVRG